MTIVQICIGSSCHLKGCEELVKIFENEISEKGLKDEIALIGGFCLGKCSREGVTVKVDDDVFTGIKAQNCRDFFNENVFARVKAGV